MILRTDQRSAQQIGEHSNQHSTRKATAQSSSNTPFDLDNGPRNDEQSDRNEQKKRGEHQQSEHYEQDEFENDYVGERQTNGRQANSSEFENKLISGYLNEATANQSIDCDDPDKEADQFCDLCNCANAMPTSDREPLAGGHTDNCLGDVDYEDYHVQDFPDGEEVDCEELSYATAMFARSFSNKSERDFEDDSNYLDGYPDYLESVYDLRYMKEISLTERYAMNNASETFADETSSSDRSNYLDDESNLAREEHFDDIHLLEEHSRSLKQEMTEFENELEFDYHDYENDYEFENDEDDCHLNAIRLGADREQIGRNVKCDFAANGIGENKRAHPNRSESIVAHSASDWPTNRPNDHHAKPSPNQSADRPGSQCDGHHSEALNRRADSNGHRSELNGTSTNQTDPKWASPIATNREGDDGNLPNGGFFGNASNGKKAIDRADKNQSIIAGPPKSGEQLEEPISDALSYGQLQFMAKELEKVSFCLSLPQLYSCDSPAESGSLVERYF